jgi:hypothetical protein
MSSLAWAWALVCCVALDACSDNGGSTAIPSQDASEAVDNSAPAQDAATADASIADASVADVTSHADGTTSGTDASPDVTVPIDSGTPADAAIDVTTTADSGAHEGGSLDAAHDAPPDVDAGCPECECSAHLAATAADMAVSNTCTASELATWKADRTGVCMDCMFQAGCLNIVGLGGSECGDLTGGAGSTNESLCVAVLECDLGVNPDVTPGPASGLTINAFCGQGVTSGACNTAPTGGCVAQWHAGFPTQSNAQIQGELGVMTFPGGMANSIATCANANCQTQCF